MSHRRSKRVRAVLGRENVEKQRAVYQVVKEYDKSGPRRATYPTLKEIHRARSHVQSGVPHPRPTGILQSGPDVHAGGAEAGAPRRVVNPGAADLQPHARAVSYLQGARLQGVSGQRRTRERARRLRQMSGLGRGTPHYITFALTSWRGIILA